LKGADLQREAVVIDPKQAAGDVRDQGASV
jgi:hypothetical protein